MTYGLSFAPPAPRPHRSKGSIPFGRTIVDGRMFEPRQVPLGKKSGCVCPACGEAVISKHCMSGKVAPHFAHVSGSDCALGYETALHLAVKQLIEERGELYFPALIVSIAPTDAMYRKYAVARELAPAGLRALSGIALEPSLDTVRPDLMVFAHGFGKTIVEVAVTHFVDEVKLTKLRTLDLPAIEIDVSGLQDTDFEALEQVLFSSSTNTTWLHHPKVASTEASMLAGLQPKLDAAAIEAEDARQQWERERAEQVRADAIERRKARAAEDEIKRQKRQRQHEELTKATAFKRRSESEKLVIVQGRLGITRLPPVLAARVHGASSFGVVNPHLWQTTLFGGLVHQRPAHGQAWVKKEFALGWMRYRFKSTPEFKESEPIAIWGYLRELTNRGALYIRKNGYFEIGVADLAAFEALTSQQRNHFSSLDDLVWAPENEWPNADQARLIASAMQKSSYLPTSWERMHSVLPSIRSRRPTEASEWAERLGVPRLEAAEFFVRAGYLRLASGEFP